jgi:hypothetical protein
VEREMDNERMRKKRDEEGMRKRETKRIRIRGK